jgi:hypothetical protein
MNGVTYEVPHFGSLTGRAKNQKAKQAKKGEPDLTNRVRKHELQAC